MLYLAKLGYVLPVLHTFEDWLHNKNLDMSLIRLFLFRLLGTSQPPYSVRFVSALTNIILESKACLDPFPMLSYPLPMASQYLNDAS